VINILPVQTYDAGDEQTTDGEAIIHLKKETSDMSLHHNTITIQTSLAKTPPRIDLNIESNMASNNLKVKRKS
jgi:hypothetical protein